MADVLKSQLRLSLEVLTQALSFLSSPGVAEVVKQLCLDRDFFEAVRKVSSAVQAVESACIGSTRSGLVKRFVAEVKRCSNIRCVRRVVEEYEVLLGLV